MGGRAMPAESFTKQAATSNSAGTQNNGLANQWSLAFFSGVLACHHSHAPTAPTPMSGEIATPVIMESVWAISLPGVFLSVAVVVVVAAACAVTRENPR